MEFDPSTLSTRDLYQLMLGGIVPRPIAWVSTRGTDGVVNVAPFSYFNGLCSRPPVLSVAIGYRKEAKKDTLVNIEVSKEFVVNVVPFRFAEAMNKTSGDYPKNVSEAEVANLRMLPGVKISAPRLADVPLSFECRLFKLVPVGEAPSGATLVLGEIVYVHVQEGLFQDGQMDGKKLDAIARMGGAWYCRTQDQFSMVRPQV